MRGLRRFWLAVRYAVSVVTLIAIAAPCALGGATGPLVRALADAQEHVCKCGMKPGTCGCPECAKLERERRADHAPSPVPVLKRHCDDTAPAMPLGAPLPTGVLAASITDALPLSRGERLPVAASAAFVPSLDCEPPTPPPRIAAV
ncbi:MAG TPA: hypothetical protein VIY73_19435 [Polyangiaceae bacterium]